MIIKREYKISIDELKTVLLNNPIISIEGKIIDIQMTKSDDLNNYLSITTETEDK